MIRQGFVPKRKRTYNTRLVKDTMSYTVPEIAELFDIHKNTIFAWFKQGLRSIDLRKPYLVRGNDLKAFLQEKKKSRKHKCALDEFRCFKCRAPRKALSGRATITPKNNSTFWLKAYCENCGTPVSKLQSVKKLPEIEKIFRLQEPEESRLSELINPSLNSDKEQTNETT